MQREDEARKSLLKKNGRVCRVGCGGRAGTIVVCVRDCLFLRVGVCVSFSFGSLVVLVFKSFIFIIFEVDFTICMRSHMNVFMRTPQMYCGHACTCTLICMSASARFENGAA
jgi:hypothetical protein